MKNGIRIVHVAGWHEYPKYTYDYARLIKLAHANGILVYAWLEPPQVSQKFWIDHPEWREKNYKGEDVRPSWRYPVALSDNSCLDAVINKYSQLLTTYDWDGVNLSELYFEADNGFDNPEKFTPMHKSAQKEMLSKYGFNIHELFNPLSEYYWKNNYESTQKFVNYRIDRITYVS